MKSYNKAKDPGDKGMKAILEFDLEDPYAKEELQTALSGGAYHSCIHDLKEHLFWQYDEADHLTDEQRDLYGEILDKLNDLLDQRGVRDHFC